MMLRMSAGARVRQEVIVVKDIADLPLLSLDRHRVLLILMNLIRNANQALDGVVDRSPCIMFNAALADGPVLRITVTDNGSGITPEHLTRIFSMASRRAKRDTVSACTAARSPRRKWVAA